jgi:hypothetical protein
MQHSILGMPTDKSDPNRALIAAILLRAFDDLSLGPRERSHVMAWVDGIGCKQQPGSFEWCCEALELNPDAVRGRYRQQVTSIAVGEEAHTPRR